MDISTIVSKDAPITTNEQGGSQSHIPVRFDLIDGKALFEMAKVLHTGAEKYGANNWRKIDVKDHLNHLIMHAYAYLSGDRSDEHLSHIMCRAMFAQAVDIESGVPVGEPASDLVVNVSDATMVIKYDGYKFNTVEDFSNYLELKKTYGSNVEFVSTPIVKVKLEKLIDFDKDKTE